MCRQSSVHPLSRNVSVIISVLHVYYSECMYSNAVIMSDFQLVLPKMSFMHDSKCVTVTFFVDTCMLTCIHTSLLAEMFYDLKYNTNIHVTPILKT